MTTFVNLPNQNQNNSKNDNGIEGYYNLIGRNLYGSLKRLRKLDKGGYYVDLVACVGQKATSENSFSGKMTYSSLRIVNKELEQALLALDEATGGMISATVPDKPVSVIVEAADLNVRGFNGREDKAGSVSVGSLLKIVHAQWGEQVFTQDQTGNLTVGKDILKNVDFSGFKDLDIDVFKTNHIHLFTGVAFLNKVDEQEDGTLRLSCQFLHGLRKEAKRTRTYVQVTKNSAIYEYLKSQAAAINLEDSTTFCRMAINITGNGAWKYVDKDKKEQICAAVYADIANLSYLSINGEVVHQQKSQNEEVSNNSPQNDFEDDSQAEIA